jgi:hypothetical protein
MLAAHATELFIKGALLTSDPTAIPEHHRIDELSAEYRKRFPNQAAFEWDIPFGIEYPAWLSAPWLSAAERVLDGLSPYSGVSQRKR